MAPRLIHSILGKAMMSIQIAMPSKVIQNPISQLKSELLLSKLQLSIPLSFSPSITKPQSFKWHQENTAMSIYQKETKNA